MLDGELEGGTYRLLGDATEALRKLDAQLLGQIRDELQRFNARGSATPEELAEALNRFAPALKSIVSGVKPSELPTIIMILIGVVGLFIQYLTLGAANRSADASERAVNVGARQAAAAESANRIAQSASAAPAAPAPAAPVAPAAPAGSLTPGSPTAAAKK